MTAKRASIHDLSRKTPTADEARAVVDEFTKGSSPIVTAILGQAVVEHDLDRVLRTQFKRKDDLTWAMLTSDIGPLATFSQKIAAGYAFKLYKDDIRKNLIIVKNIRNAFAHSKHLITFDNELVTKELRSVVLPDQKHSRRMRRLKEIKHLKYSPTGSYILLCFALDIELLGRKTRGIAAVIRNRGRVRLKSPFYGALMAQALSLPTTGKSEIQQILWPLCSAVPALQVHRHCQKGLGRY